MTPVLSGRLQTRLFVAATVGVLWTALITLVLPMPPGAGLAVAYRMTFDNLGLMTALGIGWELVYHLLQQTRWDKDWPTLLGLVTVVNEAIPLWFVDRALGIVPADAGPFVPAFAIHVGTTWLLMWLFVQGPVRVLHIRWRFEGGRVVLPVPGEWRRQDDWLDTRWLESLRATANNRPPAAGTPETGDVVDIRRNGGAPDSLVEGVSCPRGHFGSADTAYCPVCGAMRAGTDATRVFGPRPPVGVLVLADGRTRTVDEDLVVVPADDGIAVLSDGDERADSPLAGIRLVGWQPVLSARSRQATVVLPGGHRLTTAAGVPVPLVAGAEVVLGEHTLRYDSPYVVDPDAAVGIARKEGVAVPVGGIGWTSGAKRGVAVAAAVATIAGAITFAVLSGSSAGAGSRTEAQGTGTGAGVAPAPLTSFSVPPWTLPAQPGKPRTGLPTVALPGLPSGSLLHLPDPVLGRTFAFPSPPAGVVLPPPPKTTVPPPGGTGHRPTTQPVTPTPTSPRPPSAQPPPPPISPVSTTALCSANLVGLLQCTMGALGG